jgi:hypothetical protein
LELAIVVRLDLNLRRDGQKENAVINACIVYKGLNLYVADVVGLKMKGCRLEI